MTKEAGGYFGRQLLFFSLVCLYSEEFSQTLLPVPTLLGKNI
jgi:hypothetical protein